MYLKQGALAVSHFRASPHLLGKCMAIRPVGFRLLSDGPRHSDNRTKSDDDYFKSTYKYNGFSRESRGRQSGGDDDSDFDRDRDQMRKKRGIFKWVSKTRLRIESFVEDSLLHTGIVSDQDTARYAGIACSWSVVGLAGLSLAGTFGFDTQPLLAGAGVTGLAAGYAAKDVAANVVAGAMLQILKPFHTGDYIKIIGSSLGDNLQGEVVAFDIRHVELKTDSGGLLLIPSQIVYTNSILLIPRGKKNSVTDENVKSK